MQEHGRLSLDFAVVGAGVAGLRAAIELASRGRVLVLAKSSPGAGALVSEVDPAPSDEDELGVHEAETLRAGQGLCDPAAVKVLVEEGPHRIREMISWGLQFDRAGTKPGYTREGSRRRANVPHARGKSVELEMRRALLAKVRLIESITLRPQSFATELILTAPGSGRVGGLRFLDETSGRMVEVECRAVLLATGGLGQAYRQTTNPATATGDGMAIGFRAGAALADMEFIHFYPTALAVKGAPPFLLPEALRLEGAVLRNALLERFMPRYHEAAELAPPGVLCRAIVAEMNRTRTDFVYLDGTGLGEEFVARRFPGTHAACMKHGLDITADLAPVGPGAHYSIGGLKTDLFGRTTLSGLYAAGEAASTRVHGANRLAGNSLLEGLVFGARAGAAMSEEAPPQSPARKPAPIRESKPAAKAGPGANARRTGAGSPGAWLTAETCEAARERIRAILWQEAGILRHGRELWHALERLGSMEMPRPAKPSRCAGELYNLWTLAQVIVRCALAREESRGSHYRSDFPYPDDDRFAKHSLASCEGGVRFE